MELWVFSKKELKLIADLMILVLKSKPDNTKLSVTELFMETFRAKYVEGKNKDGERVSGLQISDIKLANGKHLHDVVKWDFENGIWHDGWGQGFELHDYFIRKAIKAGYVIDDSWSRGLILGLPHNISIIYRKKANLLASFKGIQEKETSNSQNEKFYIRSRNWTYNGYDEHNVGKKSKMELWRIPAECSTGVIINNENARVTCIVMKGKCLLENSYWRCYSQITESDKETEASWHNESEKKTFS